MRIAIVGATGVLGRALVARLVHSGGTVRALARSPERAAAVLPANVDVQALDLLDQDAGDRLPRLLSGCDAVIHAATAIPSDPSAPGAWDATGRLRIEGTRRLLEGAIGARVRRYVQQSIGMAYPDRGDEWIEEETPLDDSPARDAICGPVRRMEAMVRALPSGPLEWCILRAGAFVGPGTFQERTIARLRERAEPVVCGGRHFLPLVHVGDVAEAFALALDRAPACSVLNINDIPIRQGDYLVRLAELVGAATPLEKTVSARAPSLRCSHRRAGETLGWKPDRGIWPHTSGEIPARKLRDDTDNGPDDMPTPPV
jgi:nucleoside-diphosphate-sugar epimerase